MSERRITLDAAAFLDSAHAVRIAGAPSADVRAIVQRFLAACYEDLAKAPRLVDGDELAELLTGHLPRRFERGDPKARAAVEVVAAYLEYLSESAVVPHAYELRRALDEHGPAFAELVRSGATLGDGPVVRPRPKTVRHHAEKTGRNDPCPCGSGKKFKKCCLKLGDEG